MQQCLNGSEVYLDSFLMRNKWDVTGQLAKNFIRLD